MKKLITFLLSGILFISCGSKKEQAFIWQFDKVIQLDSIKPIGLAADGNDLFISDGDHNRVVKTNLDGIVLFEYVSLARPMHIDFAKIPTEIFQGMGISTDRRTLLVPQYGNDTITLIQDQDRSYLKGPKNLDAPAAISASGKYIAIADFYNHQIAWYNGEKWSRVGKEGKGRGEFYYPTDVQIFNDTVYIADAYNNRGQIFDLKGDFLGVFGEDDEINAATGIYVTSKNIYLTDFENSRVLNYDKNFNLLQILTNSVAKPTDIMQVEDHLLIANYDTGELIKFKKKENDY